MILALKGFVIKVCVETYCSCCIGGNEFDLLKNGVTDLLHHKMGAWQGHFDLRLHPINMYRAFRLVVKLVVNDTCYRVIYFSQ